MRLMKIVGCAFAMIALTVGCNEQPTAADNVESALFQQNGNAPEHWASDYFTLVPAAYGQRTFQVTAGEPSGLFATSYIQGTYTVPYANGARTGTLLFFESDWDDEVQLWHVDGKSLYLLNEGSYYLSTDCSATEFPPWMVLGKVSDGMIVDHTPGPGQEIWRIHHADPGDCIAGIDRPLLYLMQIRDVHVGGQRYNNALLLWNLVPDEEFSELDFLGREEVLGITLPTSEDTDDKAIAGFSILGFHKGILGGGEVVPTSGSLRRLVELVSIARP